MPHIHSMLASGGLAAGQEVIRRTCWESLLLLMLWKRSACVAAGIHGWGTALILGWAPSEAPQRLPASRWPVPLQG